MLNHPTLDRLNAMGLAGIARAFDELTANPEAQGLTHPEWLALLLDRNGASGTIASSPRACASPNCAIRRRPKRSITAAAANSTGACSLNSSPETVSPPTTIW